MPKPAGASAGGSFAEGRATTKPPRVTMLNASVHCGTGAIRTPSLIASSAVDAAPATVASTLSRKGQPKNAEKAQPTNVPLYPNKPAVTAAASAPAMRAAPVEAALPMSARAPSFGAAKQRPPKMTAPERVLLQKTTWPTPRSTSNANGCKGIGSGMPFSEPPLLAADAHRARVAAAGRGNAIFTGADADAVKRSGARCLGQRPPP
mmetsp:Transcript_14031/g.38344  ORF Transcript_14031/g.38344 Transcript_14031/m.38344 type:complete len:206 (-) Transcript_14031:114-731(-)